MFAETIGKGAARVTAGRGAGGHLRKALVGLGNGHGGIIHHSEKPWASITFSGSRHAIRMVFDGAEAAEAAEELIARLPEFEFSIPGQLVADATITGVEHTMVPQPRVMVECEMLLLVDA